MKLNIANPGTGQQHMIEIDDEKKLRALYDKRISNEVEGEALGAEFAGYVFKISGGNDKQGFPMKQGVLTNTRVRLLLKKGLSCYRQRRKGERKRKSVRGCIVGADLAVLNLVVVKKGEGEIPNLTDSHQANRLGPKRQNHIRKFFNLEKKEDVRLVLPTRKFDSKSKAGKTIEKKVKVQRLVTPLTLQRKHHRANVKKAARAKAKADAAAYHQIFKQRLTEAREARRTLISKRRSSRRASIRASNQN